MDEVLGPFQTMSVSTFSPVMPVAWFEYPKRSSHAVVPGNQFSSDTASFGPMLAMLSRAFQPPVGAGMLLTMASDAIFGVHSVNMEHWKPVIGFEKLYVVSDLGRVRSQKTGRLKKLTEI